VTAIQIAGDVVPLPGFLSLSLTHTHTHNLSTLLSALLSSLNPLVGAATVAGLISGAFRIYKQRKSELKSMFVSFFFFFFFLRKKKKNKF